MNGGAFPADLEPRKRAMTLEHLLTMSSGYFCDDTNPEAPGGEEIMINQTDEPDYYRFTLKVPMASEPGAKAVYCSSNPNLALGAVSRAMDESPLDIFDRLLGVPMKITRYGWPLDPAGHPYGGGGAQFLPRDFMKFGQLMLNGGTWQGRRLLSSGFVARASAPLYHLRGIYYGYLWWGIDYPYKNRTVLAFFAGGAGGVRHPFARKAWSRFGDGYVFYGSVCQLRPESRGFVRIKSADPAQAPAIQPRYLTAQVDRDVMVAGMKLIRRVMGQPAMARYIDEELMPGAKVQTDAELLEFARQKGTTVFHPTSTCRMGSDVTAVVDERLRVHGFQGLRVADASIMPTVVSGNTNAACVMIGEKASDMILEDATAKPAAKAA